MNPCARCPKCGGMGGGATLESARAMSQRRRINSWALLRSGVLSNTRLQQIHEFSKFTERLTHDSNQWRFQIARGQRRRHCVLLDYLARRGIGAATDFLQWLRQSLQLRLEKNSCCHRVSSAVATQLSATSVTSLHEPRPRTTAHTSHNTQAATSTRIGMYTCPRLRANELRAAKMESALHDFSDSAQSFSVLPNRAIAAVLWSRRPRYGRPRAL